MYIKLVFTIHIDAATVDVHDPFLRDVLSIQKISAVPTILEVICRSTGMGFAAVARVTEEKWIACAVRDEIQFGLNPGNELKLETTICNEIRQHQQPVIIDHVSAEPDWNTHHTPAMYGFESYISMPIFLKTGDFFGTLCAIDPRPNRLNTPETVGMFRLYAELLAFHLQALDKLEQAEMHLREEKETAELREQFIAILGHDLRNPIGAISNSAQLLKRFGTDEKTDRVAGIILNAAHRMDGLVGNIMDFASGRLGGGITLQKELHERPAGVLNQVVSELALVWPERQIETDFNIKVSATFDARRIAQVFSNLLGNALSHGKTDRPVQASASADQAVFILKVHNEGEPIPEVARQSLFTPFFRGDVRKGNQGLGLGLFISSEIAKAHGGRLELHSDSTGTTFTLTIPQPGAGA